MTRYVALLRAVNVGGTGKLSMSDLKAMCIAAGFERVETYISSGNVVFDCESASRKAKSELEARLLAFAGKPVSVVVRTGSEMRSVLDANPFPEKPAKYTVAIFLEDVPPLDTLDHALGKADEEMSLGRREIYIYYPNGIAHSKLKIPAAKNGTAQNMNTIAQLVRMSSKN